MPYNSTGYYVNRYYRHPIYKYGFMGIKSGSGTMDAAFVYRKCSAEDTVGIFMVDYIGEPKALKGSYSAFVKFLQSENAEYISFPCSGIEDSILRQAGFLLRDDSDVIVPVYYEPFVRKNVDLDYHYWTKDGLKDAIIVKGDADQDRPNMLMGGK
jgi:hypothetical protein